MFEEKIKKVINFYNLKVYKENFAEIYLHCPFHDDAHPSFSINKKTGKWICFAENKGGDFNKFLLELAKIYKKSINFNNEIKRIEIKFKPNLNLKIVPLNIDLNQYEEVPEIYLRGIKPEIYKMFNIKFDKKNERFVIPFYLTKKLIGIIYRNIYKEPKYMYSLGFKASNFIYGFDFLYYLKNLDDYKFDYIIITEGVFDFLFLIQNNILNISILGCHKITINQLKFLNIIYKKYKKDFLICLDGDKIGKEMTIRNYLFLKQFFPVKYVFLPENTDIDQIPVKELKDFLIGGLND